MTATRGAGPARGPVSGRYRSRFAGSSMGAILSPCSGSTIGGIPAVDLLHQIDLQLLDLHEPVPLPAQELIQLRVQVPDLQLGLHVDAVVVLRPQAVPRVLAILA